MTDRRPFAAAEADRDVPRAARDLEDTERALSYTHPLSGEPRFGEVAAMVGLHDELRRQALWADVRSDGSEVVVRLSAAKARALTDVLASARPAVEPGSLVLGPEDRFHLWVHLNMIHQDSSGNSNEPWPFIRDRIYETSAAALGYLEASNAPAPSGDETGGAR